MSKQGPPTRSRRGAAEVVEKRKAARAFNELLGPPAARVDGRTDRRRKRLLQELADGRARRGDRELKPIDVLLRVRELLELGEPLASIKKACPLPRPLEATAAMVESARRLHRAYGFPPVVYRFVGLSEAVLQRAGIVAGKLGAVVRHPGIVRVAPKVAPARRGAA